MASKHFCMTLTLVAIVLLPSVAMATDYIVGDDSGWKPNFDYQAWAKDKTFVVGDKLVFKYPAGAHNVFKVNGTGFADCIKPSINEALTTGNDVIPLATSGRKWYICGVAKHCAEGGQKLFITVQEANSNSASGFMKSGYQIVVMAMVAIGAVVAMI